ncbi:TadE family protein [Eubacterium sp.]|uniref:TadE/TadG family type IV pilus assembly protein n=1 Tax=Eubacterium sp. TaxID=142586 RepID=UPI0025CF2626|nr:TadE family protein [Eubacterium sp.]
MLINAISPINRLKGEKGQDIVEFALVLPILALLLFGIIDYGWIFFNEARIGNAAREGARFAVMNYKEAEASKGALTTEAYLKTQVEDNVKDVLPDNLKSPGANLTVTVGKITNAPGDEKIVVTVSAEVKLFTPVVSTIINSQRYTVRKQVAMKKMN